MIGKANNLLPNGLIEFETFSFWGACDRDPFGFCRHDQLATNGLKKASNRKGQRAPPGGGKS